MTPYYDHAGITIYHGDCREILPDLLKADLLLTDPPYGIGSWSVNPSGGFMTEREAEKINGWDVRLLDADLLQILSRGKYAVMWGSNYFSLPPSPRVLVWDKEQQGMHFAEVEIAWTNFDFGTSRIIHCPLKSQEVFGARSERQHPTQKPVSVMSWCIHLAGEVQTILDPFMGNGTTLRAAKDLGRKAIGIEIEERYCEIAAKRMAQEVFSFT